LSSDVLTERVATLAEWLRSMGPRGVALHMDNGPDWIIIDLACQVAEICLIPLPTFFSAGQLSHVLNTMPIDTVFTDRADLFSPLCAGRFRNGPEFAVGNGLLLHIDPPESPDTLPPGTGKVTFTSGSTGNPRGVCLSNQQLLKQAEVLSQAVDLKSPRHLSLLPLSTLLENIAGVYAPMLTGGEVVVPSLTEIGFNGSSSLDTRKLLWQLSHWQPNSLILTPQLLQILVAAARSGWVPPTSLQFVAVGGARVPAALLEAAHDLGIPAFEGYGLSECASVVSLNLPDAARPGSCGRPLPHVNVECRHGEIHVRGNAMLGYAGQPDSWGRELIATGDLGEVDEDGFIHVNGRLKNLLISSYGRNISPEWVESEMLADGLLADCVVFGDSRPYCVALLSPRETNASDGFIQDSIDRSNERLPDYARVKQWLRLSRPLAMEQGLLTDNGRPKRRVIESRYNDEIAALYRDAKQPITQYEKIA